jgi:hypothetical protein
MQRGDRDRSNGHTSQSTQIVNLTEESKNKSSIIPRHPLNINQKLSLIKKTTSNNSSEDIHQNYSFASSSRNNNNNNSNNNNPNN